MKPPRIRLVKWIGTMGYETIEANGIADTLIRKLLPYCKAYDIEIDKLLDSILKDYACTSLEKFRMLANHRIQSKKKAKTLYN